jgi:hypothetical protein
MIGWLLAAGSWFLEEACRRQASSIWDCEIDQVQQCIEMAKEVYQFTKIFTILFRAPEKHLADFLRVEKKMGRTILSNIYKKERASKITVKIYDV